MMSRGNGGAAIYRDDDDRRRFLGLVSELPERFGIEIHVVVAPVPGSDRMAQFGDSTGSGVPMIFRVPDGLDELVHDVRRRDRKSVV